MAQIAEALGVSVQTVSAVVNGKPGISSKTQARVRDAIVRLDYHPNEQARTLRGVKTKTVGVIIPSITNPYFPEFVRGVEEAARMRGYSIFLCNTDAELRHLLEIFIALIKANKASGLICSVGIVGEWLGNPDVTRWIHKFTRDEVSVVLNGRAWREPAGQVGSRRHGGRDPGCGQAPPGSWPSPHRPRLPAGGPRRNHRPRLFYRDAFAGLAIRSTRS